MQRETKEAILWIVMMCGYAFHTLADFLPLFWQEPIAVSDSGVAPRDMMVMIMALSYFIPVCGVILSAIIKSRWAVMVNFILSLLILLFNAIHSLEMLDFNPVQLPILPVILAINAILCFILWKGIRADRQVNGHRHHDGKGV